MKEQKESGTISARQMEEIHNRITPFLEGLKKVIKGDAAPLEHLTTALLAGGHVLIEDVPGLGKTTLAKTAARLIGKKNGGVRFKRIQFTPDLLPYDITGVDIYDQEKGSFRFHKGPVFTNILLGDEINRTTPKVQSALLEVMAEKQVTIGTKTYKTDPFFFVIATQNPVESEGTFPLPLAQLDRFLMKITLGYPDLKEEILLLEEDPSRAVLPALDPVCTPKELQEIMILVPQVYADPRLVRMIVDILRDTRTHKAIELGASPRGGLMLLQAARARALVRNRSYLIDQDITDLTVPVLGHRIRIKENRHKAEEIIEEITRKALAGLEY